MNKLISTIAEVSESIRYIAIYQKGHLTSWQREDLQSTSESESDKYEELLVNPTVLKILKQRGDIDCGGLEFVVVRYGHFFQLVKALEDGHLSICIETSADPIAIEKEIRERCLSPAMQD